MIYRWGNNAKRATTKGRQSGEQFIKHRIITDQNHELR
ncbi:hypothetical protein ES707_11012 [subsurface metagenome]